jgi:hypothetical protein
MNKIRFAVVVLVLSVAASATAAGNMAALKAEADAAVKAAIGAPSDYAANWKAAKALRAWGDEAVKQEVQGYKDIARSAG